MSQPIYGFAFPFQIDPDTGRVATSANSDKLRENLKQLILTEIGERVMRRDYGGGVWQLVNDPDNSALCAVVQHQIAKNVARWEPRVVLQEVVVTRGDGAEGTLWVNIQYIDRDNQSSEKLAVPFGLGGV